MKGFFKARPLNQTPGDKGLLPAPKTTKCITCDDCQMCAHAMKEVEDPANYVPEQLVYRPSGLVNRKESIKEKIAYKKVPVGGTPAVGVQGQGKLGIMIVVDAITTYGAEQGRHVIGLQKKLLEGVLSRKGIDLERDCYLVSAVRGCQGTQNAKRKTTAVKACRAVLHEDIKRLKPKVIVPMGFRAISAVWGHKMTVQADNIPDLYAGCPDQEHQAWVIPTYGLNDFSFLIRNKQARVREYQAEKIKEGKRVPAYYAQVLSRTPPLFPDPMDKTHKYVFSEDYVIKYNRMMGDVYTDMPLMGFQAVLAHIHKPFPIDNSIDELEILKDKRSILEAIAYFHTVPVFSTDIEATSLKFQRKEAEIICISMSNLKRNVAFMTQDPDIVKACAKLMDSDEVAKIAHNAGYEYSAFYHKWGVKMDNLYLDSQVLAHCYDHQGMRSGLKFQTAMHCGIFGYGENVKPFFKCIDADKGTIYEKSNQAINKQMEALARGKLYEAGLLFPLPGDSDEIKAENERRMKLYKQGWLTEDEILLYVGLDSIYTSKIVKALMPKLLNRRELDAMFMSSRNAINLAKMSANGLNTDQAQLHANMKELDDEMISLHKQIVEGAEVSKWDGGKKFQESGKDKDFVEFNYNSGAQLGRLLFDLCGIPGGKKTANGNYVSTAAALEKVDSPMVKLILKRKKLAKAKSTYLMGWERENWDGVVRPGFAVSLCLSHRTSSSNPNSQNSPKRNKLMKKLTRNFIIPRPGHVLQEFDYSQAEGMAGSIIAGDMQYLAYMMNPEADIHLDNAMSAFGFDATKEPQVYGGIVAPDGIYKRLRQQAKLLTFPLMFGSGAPAIAETIWEEIIQMTDEDKLWVRAHLKSLDCVTFEEFTERINASIQHFWEVLCPEYGQFRKDIWADYVRKGYDQFPTGFVARSILNSRVVSNICIQGSAAQKLLKAIDYIQGEFERLNLKSLCVCQVHDSLVVDTHKSELEIVDKIVTTGFITGTDNDPLFDWVNLTFRMDRDRYEGSWASGATEKRMNMKDYDENWMPFDE